MHKVRGGEASGSTSAASSKADKVERFNLKMPQRVDATAAATAEAKATAAYRARDQREMFFRPRLPRSGRRQKKRPPPRQTTTRMTDKQRAQWTREHYQQHYGKTHNQPTTTPTLPNWTPQILGYTNRPHDHCDQTLPITPPNFEDMCEYLERPLPQNVVKNLTFYLQ